MAILEGTLDSTTKRVPELDGVRGVAVLLVLVHNTCMSPFSALGAACDQWMDGSRSLLCAFWIPDHRDSPGFEEIRRLLQEVLCAPVSSHLATVLFAAAFHVRDCPFHTSV